MLSLRNRFIKLVEKERGFVSFLTIYLMLFLAVDCLITSSWCIPIFCRKIGSIVGGRVAESSTMGTGTVRTCSICVVRDEKTSNIS